ncbi:ROK family protein [Lapidilactobacillus gannanensis]|uniref:ROK family protein n=1 Tax=Lapidilactobacillus gannanensis TaxID=2486002 RepID=A0ABW4BJZ3_9LACO|nr:ROK family protein [Lapidilactobacillus gannanensis]
MNEYVSFDIGGTTIKYAMVNDTGQIFEKSSFRTVDDASVLIKQMLEVINQFKKRHQISGIGISAPGIIRKDGYMITGGSISSLNNYHLAKVLSDKAKLKVTVDNDANAAAIAESWLGAAQNIDNYLTIVLGTGIGGGIVINGQVYRGAHGMAGEFGWNIITQPDLTRSLESYSLNWRASVVNGLVRRFNESQKQFDDSHDDIKDARIIFDLALTGNSVAKRVVSEFVEDATLLIINLFANFDPDKILIGGGISSNPQFMNILQASVDEFIRRHESLNRIKNDALGRLETAKLHNDAGLIGAAYQIKQQVLSDK